MRPSVSARLGYGKGQCKSIPSYLEKSLSSHGAIIQKDGVHLPVQNQRHVRSVEVKLRLAHSDQRTAIICT